MKSELSMAALGGARRTDARERERRGQTERERERRGERERERGGEREGERGREGVRSRCRCSGCGEIVCATTSRGPTRPHPRPVLSCLNGFLLTRTRCLVLVSGLSGRRPRESMRVFSAFFSGVAAFGVRMCCTGRGRSMQGRGL